MFQRPPQNRRRRRPYNRRYPRRPRREVSKICYLPASEAHKVNNCARGLEHAIRG